MIVLYAYPEVTGMNVILHGFRLGVFIPSTMLSMDCDEDRRIDIHSHPRNCISVFLKLVNLAKLKKLS